MTIGWRRSACRWLFCCCYLYKQNQKPKVRSFPTPRSKDLANTHRIRKLILSHKKYRFYFSSIRRGENGARELPANKLSSFPQMILAWLKWRLRLIKERSRIIYARSHSNVSLAAVNPKGGKHRLSHNSEVRTHFQNLLSISPTCCYPGFELCLADALGHCCEIKLSVVISRSRPGALPPFCLSFISAVHDGRYT